jgi:hypothetical protein
MRVFWNRSADVKLALKKRDKDFVYVPAGFEWRNLDLPPHLFPRHLTGATLGGQKARARNPDWAVKVELRTDQHMKRDVALAAIVEWYVVRRDQ